MKHDCSNRLANNAGHKPEKIEKFAASIKDTVVRIAETLMKDTGQLSKPRLANNVDLTDHDF
jgi:hypothetical protein